MGNRKYMPYVLTMATGGTLTSALDFGEVSYRGMTIQTPSFVTGFDVYLQASMDGTTYRRSKLSSSGVVGALNNVILSSASQAMIDIPDFHYRYMKLEFSTATSDSSQCFNITLV